MITEFRTTRPVGLNSRGWLNKIEDLIKNYICSPFPEDFKTDRPGNKLGKNW
jgi:hypothetical protein